MYVFNVMYVVLYLFSLIDECCECVMGNVVNRGCVSSKGHMISQMIFKIKNKKIVFKIKHFNHPSEEPPFCSAIFLRKSTNDLTSEALDPFTKMTSPSSIISKKEGMS